MPKTSIRKIARTLGLAPATVFRALSGSSNVAVNTRRKVIACANKLGYMLPEHTCCNIAVVVPHFNFRGYLSHMLPRLEEILHNRGYRVHLIPEKDIPAEAPVQLDLFTDYGELQRQEEMRKAAEEKERKLQKATLVMQERFGKNAVLKGMNLEKKGTTRARNGQIGGHRAGEEDASSGRPARKAGKESR